MTEQFNLYTCSPFSVWEIVSNLSPLSLESDIGNRADRYSPVNVFIMFISLSHSLDFKFLNITVFKNSLYSVFWSGVEKALEDKSIDFRIFGKPYLKSYRRMGVILAENLENAKTAAKKISIKSKL